MGGAPPGSPTSSDLSQRAAALAEHPAVTPAPGPAGGAPLPGEPPDLVALYAVTDGLTLADGTRILGRSEIEPATTWLREDRALETWGPDLWVIGERDDLVIVRDLDATSTRAGGGVVEAPTDGLSVLARAATDLLGYLEERLGVPVPGPRAPEREARDAVTRGDAEALARALARPFYPGSERELAHAALTLGALRARAGDSAAALEAFGRAVEARVRAAPRGAAASGTKAGWKTCAVTAEKAGAPALAAECRARANG